MLDRGETLCPALLAVLLQGAGHIAPSGLRLGEGGEPLLPRYGVGLRDTLVLDAAHDAMQLAACAGQANAPGARELLAGVPSLSDGDADDG